MNFGTLFSGGEGVGVGLAAAGLHHAWVIEYDAQIAAGAATVFNYPGARPDGWASHQNPVGLARCKTSRRAPGC